MVIFVQSALLCKTAVNTKCCVVYMFLLYLPCCDDDLVLIICRM